jgi:hypothetical protein
LEDDPATPKAWLPDRTAQSSTAQSSTTPVIFDPGYWH